MKTINDCRTSLSSWQALQHHALEMKTKHMIDLFKGNSQRFDEFSLQLPEMLLDYSKNLITKETMEKLIKLALECDYCGLMNLYTNKGRITYIKEVYNNDKIKTNLFNRI